MTKSFYVKNNLDFKIFSTALPVISLIENIEKAISNKIFVCGVFADFQKAFDTVDRNILLHELPNYGIRDSQFLVFLLLLKQKAFCSNKWI